VQNGWIFKGRRGGCPFYVYLEDEDAGGIRRTGAESGLEIGDTLPFFYSRVSSIIKLAYYLVIELLGSLGY